MTRMIRGLLFSLLLSRPVFGGFDVELFWETLDTETLIVRGFTEPATCYERLLRADANQDYQLSQEEFVTYVKISGPDDFVSDIDEFQDLPLAFTSTFVALSCMCADSSKTTCCDDQVGISGANGNPDRSQANDLFLICSLTRIAVDRVLTSITPSAAPTEAADPTASPTKETVAPALDPSPPPTVDPSPSPTVNPSPLPTDAPSSPPVKFPSPLPTLEPTTVVTPPPSPVEGLDPTASPSPTEAPRPTATPEPIPAVTIDYRVGVDGGVYGEEYNDELIGAMDALAPELLALGRRRLYIRTTSRRLQSVVLPTLIDNFRQDECDAVLPSNDGCASIQASVMLQFQPEDDVDQSAVIEKFKSQILKAISSGELQEKVETLYPDTDLYIIDDKLLAGLSKVDGGDDDKEAGGLLGGEIAGVAVASVIVVAFFLLYAAATKGRRRSKDDFEPLAPAPKDLSMFEDELDETHAKGITEGQLGATTPDYLLKKKEKHKQRASSPHHSDHDSDAGDSGWSSSAGVSSLNTGDQTTGSGEELDFENNQMASSLGTPSKGSASGRYQGDEASVPNTPGSVTRTDLDSAIEAGDWAAVGATAALLAAGSDTASFSSRSLTAAGTSTIGGSTVSSHEAARAAELDHLVDAGDWEGVVLAAAQFEASSTVASDTGSRMSKSGDGASSMASSTVSRSKKMQEYRAQVVDLVQRVVPEEIENVDEMMLQFRGREEELVETLRTMQERQVAQKSRQGAQKAAKADVKKSATDAKSLFGFGGFSAASSKSLGTGQLAQVEPQASARSLVPGSVEASAKSLGTGSIVKKKPASTREQKQSNLEKAIEAGDWEAVGEAAAMLNDASSASSADTDEINRLADGLSSQGSNLSGDSVKRATRAEELDKLIDKGDWMGVVQAASEFESEEDKKSPKKKSWFGRKQKKEGEEDRKEKGLQRLQAEQEALQEAEVWMAVAEKTNVDSEGDRGASEAADWAIGRSLAALVEAEGTGELHESSGAAHQDGSDSEDEV